MYYNYKLRYSYLYSNFFSNLSLTITFPIDGFKQFGYSIEKKDKIDHNLLKQLLDGLYDIIVLDIYGIATPEISEDDGLGIL